MPAEVQPHFLFRELKTVVHVCVCVHIEIKYALQ